MLLNLGLHPAVVLPCIGVAAMWEGHGPDFSRPGCKAYFGTCLILCQLLRSMAPDVCDTHSPHPAALWLLLLLLLLSLTWLKSHMWQSAHTRSNNYAVSAPMVL